MTDYFLTLSTQVQGLKNVPMSTLMNWPAYFSFAAVRVVAGTIIGVIPNMGGPVGVLINAGVAGFTDVVKFVTWENVRAA